MNKIFDITKNWTFIYPDLIPDKLDIKPIVNPEGKIEFTIPYGAKGIIVTFHSYDKEKREIQATYHIVRSGVKGEIDFKILEKGKLLEGIPSLFRENRIWRIVQHEADQPQPKHRFFRWLTSKK